MIMSLLISFILKINGTIYLFLNYLQVVIIYKIKYNTTIIKKQTFCKALNDYCSI
jgi:hypothetical protein